MPFAPAPLANYGVARIRNSYSTVIRATAGLVTYWPGGIFNNSITNVPSTSVNNYTLPAQWTMEIWVKFTSGSPGNCGIFSVWTTNGVMLWVDSTNARYKLHVNATDLDSGIAPALGFWTYLAGTYDGTSRSIFVNGRLLGGPTSGVAPVAVSTPLIAGNYAGSGNGGVAGLPGSLRDAAVYSRALSPAEVYQHYLAGISATPTF